MTRLQVVAEIILGDIVQVYAAGETYAVLKREEA